MSDPKFKRGFITDSVGESLLTLGDALADMATKCTDCGCDGKLGYIFMRDISTNTAFMILTAGGDFEPVIAEVDQPGLRITPEMVKNYLKALCEWREGGMVGDQPVIVDYIEIEI